MRPGQLAPMLFVVGLMACTAEDQIATIRLDLSACLVPRSVDAPGCGQALADRFKTTGDRSIPACMAVAAVNGGTGATLALAVSPIDGTMTPRGGAEALPLPVGGSELAFKLFVLDDPDISLCNPSMFQPDRACDARLPRCLMATKTVFGTLAADGRLEVVFGVDGEACEFECNDTCAPGDDSCVSVCHQADPSLGAAGTREACDGRDNDCDGLVDEGCDEDRDGYCAAGVPVAEGSDCFGQPVDCDDSTEAIHPGAFEPCDGVDNNCDGRIDERENLDLPPACPLAIGACARSLRRCVDGGWIDSCGAREYGDTWDGDREERCDDGIDNDCDGTIDDRDSDCSCRVAELPRACSVDLGACQAGVQECVPAERGEGGEGGEGDAGEGEGEGDPDRPYVWGPCQGTTRSLEICDGIDNDCDGSVDEGLVAGGEGAEDVAPVCPDKGVCVGRRTVCLGGQWRCDVPALWAPVETRCDGVDEDCDGEVDEDLAPPAGLDVCPVDGVCGGGGAEPQCDSALGRWRCAYPASGYEAQESTCDGIDNDCDGQVDETCACEDGEKLACGTDEGRCEAGTQECDGGSWGPCAGGVRPAQEQCDGADDDCDGRTDEGLSPPEELCPDAGVCAGEPTICADGGWRCAADDKQEPETACDGLDNDCDGMVDESQDLLGPEQRHCPDRGVCAGRPNICVEGNWRCDHPPEYQLTESRCDGLDNDCDGQADELPLDEPDERPCAAVGVCGEAVLRCADGVWNCDLGADHEPDVELSCDGRDNDCDGVVDEAADKAGPLRQTCYEAIQVTRGVGECQDGHYLCLGGDWDESECRDQVWPVFFELCDGLDNDCDGLTDEHPQGDGLLVRDCYTGDARTRFVGACLDGEQECVGGAWEAGCDGEVVPEDEFCNGADDDCNDHPDDLPPLTCGVGRCVNTVPACTVGQDNICTPLLINAQYETCDGVDDDCDGITDNAPPVSCGDGRCEVEVVACAEGRDNECVPDVEQLRGEVCDGVDDDCDGATDEGPEHGEPLLSDCYEGPEATEDVGFCHGGLRTCADGDFGECEGQVLPVAEACAAQDRDCDGELDNGPTPALAPDGAGAPASLTPGYVFGRGDFTFEGWVLRDGGADDPFETFMRQGGGDGSAGIAMRFVGAGGAPAVLVTTNAGTIEILAENGTAVDTWIHLAVERWAGAIWLYVNGAVAGSESLDPALRIDPQGLALVFGARTADQQRLSGVIDEVRITRGARYRGAAFLPSERLIADDGTAHLWRFSEGEGATAGDSVANGRDLVVAPARWTAAGVPDRRVFFEDGDDDGVGGGGAVILACVEPEGNWAEVQGDCNDGAQDVGLPVFEVLDNQIDDDCDGRLDDEDGIRAMDLRSPAAFLSVGSARAFYLRNTDWTVSVWVRLQGYATGAMAPLSSNRKSVGNGADGWMLGIGGLGAVQGLQRRLVLTLDDDEGDHLAVSSDEVPLGRWVHLAATYTQGDMRGRLWIDGRPQADEVLVATPFGRPVFQIGRSHDLGAIDTHAVIDDLHISTVARWDAAFTPPVCPEADDDTLALWRFEEADGDASPEGAQAARTALLWGGAERVAAACEGKAPPPADCLALVPREADLCWDLSDECIARADLAGGTCAQWCESQGQECASAYPDDETCVLGEALAAGCAQAAQEALCGCSR